MLELLEVLRGYLIKFLNKIPYLLVTVRDSRLYIMPDAFGSLEENLISDFNIYFSPEEISAAHTIIDLGAHHGSFTVYAIRHASKGSRIIAVEPNPAAFRLLLNNIKLNYEVIIAKHLRVEAICKAVGAEQGKRFLKITAWSESPHLTSTPSAETIVVDVITIDQLLEKVDPPVLVKMDIEGAEYELFKQKKWLKHVNILAAEIHGKYGPIIEVLQKSGFQTKIKEYHITRAFANLWVKVSPKFYTLIIALYRIFVSILARPKIIVVKAYRQPS